MRAHSLFVLWYQLSKKSQTRRQKVTSFNFVLLKAMFCFLSFVGRHFTSLKWLKVLKLCKMCLKMVKAMTPKTNDKNIFILSERISFNLYCRFIKLIILINNYLRINRVSTRNLRPWHAKHKMSGRFQSENWTEHVTAGLSYALVHRV